MKKGIIQYADICEQSLDNVTNIILSKDRLHIDSINLGDLCLVDDLPYLIKFTNYSINKVFGWGSYIIFDGADPIYVGAAEKHFLHRFQSHLHIDNRSNWGWNTLLFKLTGKDRKKDIITSDELLKAQTKLRSCHVFRVNLQPDSVPSMCFALERELMIGFKFRFPNLLNKPKRVHSDYLQQSLRSLVEKRNENTLNRKAKATA